MLSDAIRSEIREILADHQLADGELEQSDGFANLVVATTDHVIRLNGGRFPHAFRHEASVLNHLPPDIPRPQVVGYGTRSSGGEYLILKRLPGNNLERAWPGLTVSDRASILQDLGRILKRLHALPISDWMRNPWIDDAISANRWGDVYHALPHVFPQLIDSAARRRPDLQRLLIAVSGFISARLNAFDSGAESFIHTDLHFRNIVVDGGRISGLVDFEGSRVGPTDTELDMLLRSLLPDTPEVINRFPGAVMTLRRVYPDLFASDRLVEKLEVHEAIWQLVQLHNWTFGQTWTSDPAGHLGALIAGGFSERMQRLLDE